MRRILYSGLLIPFSKIPLCLAAGFKPILFIVLYFFLRYRKSTIVKNIDRSFPTKDSREKNRIRTKYYWHLATLIIESVANIGFTKKQLMKRLRFVNSEQVQSYLDQNRNVIIVGGHFGNWEWVITALGLVFHKTFLDWECR